MKRSQLPMLLSGFVAGAINGLLGTGAGMVLVPLLTKTGTLEERQVFPASVSIILPICLVSLLMSHNVRQLPIQQALPYLIACIPGGFIAGLIGEKIPVKWLHRILGVFVLYGGIRYLC